MNIQNIKKPMIEKHTNNNNNNNNNNNTERSIDKIGEDIIEIILNKLPAKPFGNAACVSILWNTICDRILFRPKFSSAISSISSLKGALDEVVDKVLSEPIRPHFAILCIAPIFDLEVAHKYITEKLGSRTPVVSYKSRGIMGNNASTNEFKERIWEMDPDTHLDQLLDEGSYGISLTVGFLPGLKVDALPLVWPEGSQAPCIEKFVYDVSQYTTSLSSCTSPVGIIMFGGLCVDMNPVLGMMDCGIHPETFIVGDECCDFLFRAVKDGANINPTDSCAAVALLFMKDSNKPRGIGDIHFHVTMSSSLAPIGPTFRAAAVKDRTEESSTWLSATNGNPRAYINGQTMLHDIEEELRDLNDYPGLYIGVTKRRKYRLGQEKATWSTSIAFHDVGGGDDTYLFVHGCGIKTGDYFRFYYPDLRTALSTSHSVSKDLKKLKQDFDASADKKQVFGGFIFSCVGRGESFFANTNVDSTPFLENFPDIPLGGTFCGGEINRGNSSFYFQESQEQSSMRCCLHAFSSVYLIMSYTPPQLENRI